MHKRAAPLVAKLMAEPKCLAPMLHGMHTTEIMWEAVRRIMRGGSAVEGAGVRTRKWQQNRREMRCGAHLKWFLRICGRVIELEIRICGAIEAQLQHLTLFPCRGAAQEEWHWVIDGIRKLCLRMPPHTGVLGDGVMKCGTALVYRDAVESCVEVGLSFSRPLDLLQLTHAIRVLRGCLLLLIVERPYSDRQARAIDHQVRYIQRQPRGL